ncbi:Aminopeptidase 2 mitochondrial [Malassezia cuniculi]|uniref:Aminopeptidase 2 mitochondrial n=1 Tax=Malassezia cuniculi TaxID=948313 RepID=A0AAF0J6K5_9BASI|nr:Aminopeptidase 2 mitochondrial [Malassezia cuniculi]
MSDDAGGVRALLARLREQDAKKEAPRETPPQEPESIRRRWVRSDSKAGAAAGIWAPDGVQPITAHEETARDAPPKRRSGQLSLHEAEAAVRRLAKDDRFVAELRKLKEAQDALEELLAEQRAAIIGADGERLHGPEYVHTADSALRVQTEHARWTWDALRRWDEELERQQHKLAKAFSTLSFTQRLQTPVRVPTYKTMTTTAGDDGSKWFRLPAEVRPEHYDLTIVSDLERLEYSGVVTATLNIQANTSSIAFNAADGLRLSQVLVEADGVQSSPIAPQIDAKHERVTVPLGATLAAGARAKITVAFSRPIDGSMMGYYHSTWSHEGRKGNYALTQFEPTSARRAFPCWDEPELKATYAVQLVHRTATTALGNMPADDEHAVDAAEVAKILRAAELSFDAPKLEGEWTLTRFGTTPRVSSYLVAWADGEFEHISGSYKSPLTGNTVPMRVYTTPEYIHQAQFALEVKERVLPEYERVFDVAYPLPKLDTLVASDFDAGAMENWGLITGRTSVFLYDEKSGLQGKKVTAGVQSHECAHMWFGNIATLAWWDNLWLNEAFATLMGEVIILDRVFPEWRSASDFIVSHLGRALDLDAKRSSHPIEVPLAGDNVEDAINQVFDAISYSKGASVLRMLAQTIIGEDVFLRGVSIYLKRHLYGNATTRDLWSALSEASGVDVPAIMDNWVLRQGFPVLTVTDAGSGRVNIRQNRFLSTGDVRPEEDETIWHVPLALRSVVDGKRTDTPLVLDTREKTIEVDGLWKLNADTVGVYRVAYPTEHLAKLGAAAKREGFSLEDRVGLVSDAFTLAQAGYSRTSGSLALMHALRGDDSYLVNQAAAQNLAALSSALWEAPADVRAAIDRFRAAVFGPLARELTFDAGADDSNELRELRTTVVTAAAAAGDEWALSQVRERFAPLAESGDDSKINPDLLRAVLANAVRYGGEREYEAVLAVYHKPATPAHKNAAMLALGATRDPKLISRTIEFLFGGTVKPQDYMYFFSSLSSNVAGRRVLWDTVQERFDELVRTFDGNFSLAGLLRMSIASLTTDKDADAVEAFFRERNTSKYSMALAQGLDAIRSQARWLARDTDDVIEWLRANGYL